LTPDPQERAPYDARRGRRTLHDLSPALRRLPHRAASFGESRAHAASDLPARSEARHRIASNDRPDQAPLMRFRGPFSARWPTWRRFFPRGAASLPDDPAAALAFRPDRVALVCANARPTDRSPLRSLRIVVASHRYTAPVFREPSYRSARRARADGRSAFACVRACAESSCQRATRPGRGFGPDGTRGVPIPAQPCSREE
jgi:hypothetical protein